MAHYDQTAIEIWKQCEGKIDYLVAGAGTGGTISGIGRKLKELSPNIKIIAVDPKGSILDPSSDSQNKVGFYEVEGIGCDIFLSILFIKLYAILFFILNDQLFLVMILYLQC